MELKILSETGNKMDLEIKGESHTLPNVLRKELWNHKATSIAAYSSKHPLVSSPVLTLQTESAKPRKVLIKAVDELKKKIKSLRNEVKKLK